MGMATLETVAHPFVAALGNEKTSDQRVNFAQSFNGLGAIIGPLLGGYFIFGKSGLDDNSLDSVKDLYTWIGVVILTITIIFSFIKVPSLKDPHAEVIQISENENGVDASVSDPHAPLWKQRHFIFAVIAQFFNIAAQGGNVGIFY